MEPSINNPKETTSNVAIKRKLDLSRYFHDIDFTLTTKFNLLYKLCDMNDNKFSSHIGVSRQSMNRYKRGVWLPPNDLKILICRKFTELIGKQVDTMMLWGDIPFNFNKEDVK